MLSRKHRDSREDRRGARAENLPYQVTTTERFEEPADGALVQNTVWQPPARLLRVACIRDKRKSEKITFHGVQPLAPYTPKKR